MVCSLADMKSILLLTCLCFIGESWSQVISKRVLDFLSFYNGNFDNSAQIKEAGDDHDFVQVRLVPVDVKYFQPDPAVFVEEAANNKIRLFIVAVVKEGIEDTVSLTIYNFTDSTKYKPRKFNPENLSNISFGDLQGDPDCIASFRVANERYVYGNFPQCSITVNGEHSRFTSLHTCETLTVTMPMYAPQSSPVEPYELVRTDQRYPLINPPQGYRAPCGN